MYTIYGLRDPMAQEIRYVGVSKHPEKRFIQHIKDKDRTHKACWIRSLLAKEMLPELVVIERCNESDYQDKERKWIAFYKTQGNKLTNATDGGDGVVNPTQDERERRSRNASRQFQGNAYRKGMKNSPEAKEKNRIAQKRRWDNLSEEQKKKNIARLTKNNTGRKTFLGKHHTPEWRAIMHKAVIESNIRRTGSKNTLKTRLLKSMAAIMCRLPYSGA